MTAPCEEAAKMKVPSVSSPRHQSHRLGIGTKHSATAAIWIIYGALFAGIEIGGSVQPSRLAVVVVFGATSLGLLPVLRPVLPSRAFMFVALLWLCWGIASLAWTPELERGARELVGITLGFITVFTVGNLVRALPRLLHVVRKAWVLAFCLTLPICLAELVWDWHMPHSDGSVAVGGGDTSSLVYFAATFGNRNTYICFILLAYPFILWGLADAREFSRKLFHGVLVIFSFGIVATNTSRLGVVVISLQTLFWLGRYWDWHRVKNLAIPAILIACLPVGGIWLWSRSDHLRTRFLSAVSAGEDTSIGVRWAQTLNGLILVGRTGGVGVGAGGFATSITRQSALMSTQSGDVLVVDPHNLWIEIASQYGVAVCAAFIAWLGYCFVLARRASYSKDEIGQAGLHGTVLLVGLPLIGLINSAFVTVTMLWAALAAVAAIADQAWIRERRHACLALASRSTPAVTASRLPVPKAAGSTNALIRHGRNT